MRWKRLRLSIAGGEPLLYPRCARAVIKFAKQLGFNISLITNGSLLSLKDLPELSMAISMIGISLDSINPKTNLRIGRVDQSGRILSIKELEKEINAVRSFKPGIFIKINTVVNAENDTENLTELIERLRPQKWKILKMLPVTTDRLTISNDQFNEFLYRHRHLKSIISSEDNIDMKESYIMVDPFGRFFQNHDSIVLKSPYIYSEKINEVGAEVAFSQIRFDCTKFSHRYSYV